MEKGLWQYGREGDKYQENTDEIYTSQAQKMERKWGVFQGFKT